MTTETVLTDEEIITLGQQARAIETGGKGYILPVTFARAIEQAVLQSPEIQAMRKDAGRYRWIERQSDAWAVLGSAYDLSSEYDGVANLSESIDAAIEQHI